ncbi:restriction endonuclease subunit S [Neobacillus pocheonensis]|uniref:Restriction endonuclease subunit S n=1 Tax=Neobacillus pocheonensis TaxID=363869 RepID=A0ABT0W749_9BACI|nr:restriction endonuclease subunit S [Neobacillus pocheonensis]
MNNSFMRYKMGELCRIKHGYPFQGEYFSDEGKYIILTPGNFYEQGGFKRIAGKEKFYLGDVSEEYICKKGDLIVAMTEQAEGLLGSTALVPEDDLYLHNQRIGLIFPENDLVDKLFLYYLFMTKSVRKRLRGSSSGTKVKHTSPEKIYDVEVWIPKIKDQRSIALLLYNIDKKIDINNKINDNLQQQAKLLYDYWFTQFDFPDVNGNPYKASGGQMVWDENLKREIPFGWTSKSIINNPLVTVLKPGVDVFDRKTYLATAEVNGTSISTGNVVEYATRESRANMQPTVNSVWFAKMKNSIKHLFLNEEMISLINSSILSTGFCGLQCTEKSFEYISSFIGYSYFETIKDTLAHGATQEAVNNDDLDGVFMVIPDDKTLSLYHDATKCIYAKISKNICENQELVGLKDWLLPMLMNGQVTVTD